MTEYMKDSRESRQKLQTKTKKQVFQDDILKKGHFHGKDAKAHRHSNKQSLKRIDLDKLDDYEDIELEKY